MKKRVVLSIDSDDEEGATDSTSKKNDFVIALLEHKARAGVFWERLVVVGVLFCPVFDQVD